MLDRPGQTEAAADLARLVGLASAGVVCEIMKADGTMARVPDLIDFCRVHQLKMITVADIIRYRVNQEIDLDNIPEALMAIRHEERINSDKPSRLRRFADA